MTEQDDDSFLSRIRATGGKNYRSLIAGHQNYQTVSAALNSPAFWSHANRSLGRTIRNVIKELKNMWRAANKY